jgi:DNA-binding MarR family transcriptional regulator
MTEKSELPIALRAAYLAMHRQSDARFEKYGVTADQFVLLATLARGHALTQRELARRMPSDPSTVRAMLILLEKQGLVEREVHPNDSRARTVALTAAGKRKFRHLWNAGEQIRTLMLDAIKPDDAAVFIGVLNRLSEKLNSQASSGSSRKQRNGI